MRYAVKCISKQEHGHVAVHQEVSIMQALSHMNLLSLLQTFETPGMACLVLELCEGGDLHALVSTGCLGEPSAAVLQRQVLVAVEHMHSRGIAHRDLKPENVLLLKTDGVVKVSDFGSAARFDPRRPLCFFRPVGTAYYSAPEVFRGRYGPQCDLWSAGVLLYIMLSGMALSGNNTRDPLDDRVSSSAHALVSALMELNISARLTAEQSLRHIWFMEHSGPLKGEADSDDTESTRCADDEGLASLECLNSEAF
jgi:calcium-dependent protein kinase